MTEYFDGWLTNLSKYIADLNTELVKTKAENAELLRELDLTKRMYAKVSEEKCVADSENAKLRELVADAIPLIGLGNVDCSGCLHMRECYAGEATDFAPENCRLVVRARELGVGVDE